MCWMYALPLIPSFVSTPVIGPCAELSKVGNTFLQLRLTLQASDESTSAVVVELTLPQFYSLLADLQAAKATLDYLS